MTNSRRRRGQARAAMEIDGIFARSRTAAEARRIGGGGRSGMQGTTTSAWALRAAHPPCKCSRTMPAPAKICLEMASGADIRRPAPMVPAQFFFAVAMVEESLEGPRLLPFGAAGRGRAAPAGAQSTGRTTSSSCASGARTAMTQHGAAAGLGPGRKTVGRCVGPAKALSAAAVAVLPTPRACEERLRGLADPRASKSTCPAPAAARATGRHASPHAAPGAGAVPRQLAQRAHKAPLRQHQALGRPQGLAASPSPAVNWTVNGTAMCKNRPLDLGPATAGMGDEAALPGGRFLRIHDGRFRGAEKARHGARREGTVGRRTLEKMGGEGGARSAGTSRKRLPRRAALWAHEKAQADCRPVRGDVQRAQRRARHGGGAGKPARRARRRRALPRPRKGAGRREGAPPPPQP